MDREIPWREIVNKDQDTVRSFVKAVRKEESSWKKYTTVKPCSPEYRNKVLKDPSLRRRCMKARACYRNKNASRTDAKGKELELEAKDS